MNIKIFILKFLKMSCDVLRNLIKIFSEESRPERNLASPGFSRGIDTKALLSLNPVSGLMEAVYISLRLVRSKSLCIERFWVKSKPVRSLKLLPTNGSAASQLRLRSKLFKKQGK